MIENTVLFEELKKIKGQRILCVGDVMLDQFVYGSIDRISPEAPIPVLHAGREKQMLGGAGNVATNLRALEAEVAFVAVVGNDPAGAEIEKLFIEAGASADLVTVQDRQTTLKTRFVCGSQQMLRVDRETTAAIPAAVEDKVIALATKAIPNVSAVILSDYKKGLLTDRVVAEIIAAAKKAGKPVIVDPKGQDFTRYKGAAVITPNKKELEAATGMSAGTDDEVRAACLNLISTCGVPAILATRGKDGMSLVQQNDDPVHIAAQVREVFDVSGAGDTVVATFATALGAGVTARNAALLANVAAGIVVGKAGTATARPDEIARALEEDGAGEKHSILRKTKLVTKEQAAEQAERWRAKGAKVGFTNGTFDLVHPGHISSMRQAKAAVDYLIVAINSDASVKRYKGPTRPVQDEQMRSTIISALEPVDLVVIFEEDTPYELIKAIKPDVLAKGGQYKLEEVVGYDIVMSYGGKILRADMEEGMSTTNTIKKMAS
jgi:D-beta-D-heptose 7-phosphate kinase/D-beta-D-heptose 1-phosphate adenosyltransferase